MLLFKKSLLPKQKAKQEQELQDYIYKEQKRKDTQKEITKIKKEEDYIYVYRPVR